MTRMFELDCGRSVDVEAFYCQRTYLGLIEGQPNRLGNDRILRKVRSEMTPLWGTRKVYVVQPEYDMYHPDRPRLPSFRFTAWLTGDPIDRQYMGSELVVAWFRGPWLDEPLAKVIHDGIRAIPWDELARDFDL